MPVRGIKREGILVRQSGVTPKTVLVAPAMTLIGLRGGSQKNAVYRIPTEGGVKKETRF
jgi:hypothetical protein